MRPMCVLHMGLTVPVSGTRQAGDSFELLIPGQNQTAAVTEVMWGFGPSYQ